jgi:hypothetical protein
MSKMQVILSSGDLEKLLLDESGEIKVAVGRQIAENFSRKYLLAFFEREINRQYDIAKSDEQEALLERVGFGNWKLKPGVIERIKNQAKAAALEEISDAVTDAVREFMEEFAGDKVSKWVSDALTYELKQRIYREARDAYQGAINSVQIK